MLEQLRSVITRDILAFRLQYIANLPRVVLPRI